MKEDRRERIRQLVEQGETERAELVAEVAGLRRRFDERREKLRFAGTALTAVATAATVAYKFFGSGSLAVRVGRIASAAGVLFQLSRAAFRTKRFW